MFVAVVTGLQMVILLGLAFVYGCSECSKKLSKKYKKSEESKKRRKKDQWEEDVTNMEVCLKANKERKKGLRQQARIVEQNRQCEAEKRAQKKEIRDHRVAIEKQHFLNARKRLAESQL